MNLYNNNDDYDDKDNIDDIDDDDDIDLSSVIFLIFKKRKIINFVCYHKQLKESTGER